MEKVSFKPVDPILVEKVFSKHRTLILAQLPHADIQHIGATSVKGLITKGDVDLQVRVNQEDFKKAQEELKRIYEVNQFENWTDTFSSFKDDIEEPPVGVQLTHKDSKEDDHFYKLRDRLNRNSELVESFNQLKRQYEGASMEDYRKAKSEFIEDLLNK